MSDRDNLESGSDQPPAKKAKSHYDTLSSHQTQQSSQGSQDIIIETGHHQGQLNTRHTINVIVNNNKRERQKRYREQNRDKLKQREAERRERIHFSQSIAGPSTSSNTNRIELNNEEIITAQSSSGLEEIQPSSIQSNDQGNEQNALQKKRERQQRYREQNRDKLKQREAERRRRLQNADVITELAASPNIEFTGIINDPIIDEISTNSQNIASLEEMQHGVVEVSQQIGRSQSSANSSEIPNNYSRFRYHKSAHEYFNDNFKNNEFGHACSICDRLWFEKDLKKPSASGSIINTITNGQNVDTLKVCSTCKSALDKNNIPNFSVYNGFHYPKIPQHLPKIDFITERLISPRIPFMQIRRLRHVQGQFGIYGQIINVPVSVDTMYLSQRSPAARPLPCEPIKVTSGPSLKYQAHPALGADFNPVITDIKSEADVIKQEEDPQSDDTLSLTEDADQQSDDDHQSDVDQPAEHLIPLSNVQIPLTNAPDPLSEVKVEEVEPGLDEVEDIKPVVVTSTVDRTRSVELTTPAELEEFRPVELSRTAEETSPGAYEEPTVPLPQYLRQELSRLGNNCYSLILKQADEINQLRVRCERQRRKLNGFVQLVRRRDNKISSLRAEIHELTTRTHLRGMQIRSFNTVVRQKKPNRQLLIVKREYKPPKSSVSVQHEPDTHTHTTTVGHKRASHLHTSHNDRNTSSGAKRTIDLQENSSDSIPDTSDVLRKSSVGVKCKSDTLQRSSSYIPGTSDVLQNPTVCTLDTQHKSLVRISDKSNVLKNRSFGVKCPLNSQEKSSVSIPGTSDGLQKPTVVKRTLDTQQNSTSGIPSTSNVRQTFSTDVKHDLDLKNNPSMVIQPLSVVPQTSVGFQRTSDVRPNKLVIQIDGMHNHVLQPKLVRLEDNSMETS